jgi:apolipoprotein N-acyltransferase
MPLGQVRADASVSGSWGAHALAALALGAAFTVGLVHTTWAWAQSLLVLLVLAWVLAHARSARRGFVIGWLFSAAWIASCTWWLVISMHQYGGLPLVLAVLATGLLALALGLYFGLACAWFVRVRPRVGAWRGASVFAGVFALAELARAKIFTGFPWGAAGYTQVDAPLAGLAPWVGVFGLGAVMALLAMAIVLRARGSWWVAAVVLLTSPWAAREFTQSNGTLSVSLIQPNVPQDLKFDPVRMVLVLQDLIGLVGSANGDFVLAPETAVPMFPQDLQPPGLAIVDQAMVNANRRLGLVGDAQRRAMVGVPMGHIARGYTNSVSVFGDGVNFFDAVPRYRYDKHHLVPFGEFIPYGFLWFVRMMNIPLGDFSRGVIDAPSFAHAGQRIAPNICYEDLFGEELAQRHRDPNTSPTIHANLSNIAWFGDTVAIDQHRNISRLRTLEFQRPMIRATNTGATAVIDHRGVVQDELPRLTRGVLEAQVEGRRGETPYARWMSLMGGAWGLMALLALAVASLSGRVVRPLPRDS